MAKVLFLLFLLGLSFTSCTKNDKEPSKDNYEFFQANLKASMTYTEIVSAFGEPDGDTGSGIHIYYYNLDDGTCIFIGYTDRIMYARHMSSSNAGTAQLLHTII